MYVLQILVLILLRLVFFLLILAMNNELDKKNNRERITHQLEKTMSNTLCYKGRT